MNVALTHMVGILWFDWLFRQFRAEPREHFEREVVESLAVVAAAGALLAAYQGLVDITWLAGSQWPAVNRAGGSLVDGNGSGMLTALWSTLFLTLLFSQRPGVRAFGWLGVVAAWLAVWASGSWTAVAAAVFGLCFLWRGLRKLRRDRSSWRPVVAVTCVVPGAPRSAFSCARRASPPAAMDAGRRDTNP